MLGNIVADITYMHEHYIVVARKTTNNGLKMENQTVLLKKKMEKRVVRLFWRKNELMLGLKLAKAAN